MTKQFENAASKLIKAHREAGEYAARLQSFHTKRDTIRDRFAGSRIFGKWNHDLTAYTVYSYRDTWPMFTFSEGRWYGHREKYSRSTTAHANHAQPVHSEKIEWTDFDNVREIALYGVTMWVTRKLNGLTQ